MVKSLYSGVSGLKTHQQRMDVIGNNIANVNTIGNKADVVTFKDVYYQTKRSPSAATSTLGGVNPRQVGYGVQMNTTSANMTQSGYTQSDNTFDMAIYGNGFFQVMDGAGNIYYTRAGIFNIDDAGYLVNADGYHVLGVTGNSDGQNANSEIIRVVVPATDAHASSATKEIAGTNVTLSVSAPSDHTDMTVTFVDSNYPYATYANNILSIYFNRNVQYESEQDFENAINLALQAGGVTLPDDVELQFDFESIPDDPNAKTAYNNISGFKFTTTNATAEFNYKLDNGQWAYMRFQVDDATNTDNIKIEYKEDGVDGEENGVKVLYDEKAGWTITIGPESTKSEIDTAIKEYIKNPTADDGELMDIEVPNLSLASFYIPSGGTQTRADILEKMFGDPDPDADTAIAGTGNTLTLAGAPKDKLSGSFDFTMTDPGAYANDYKIVFSYIQGYDKTKAVWDDKTITVSICANSTIADVNRAIVAAANGDTKKMIKFNDIAGLDFGVGYDGSLFTVTKGEDGSITTTRPDGATRKETTGAGGEITITYTKAADPADGPEIKTEEDFYNYRDNVWNPGLKEAFFGDNPSVNPMYGDDAFFTKVAKSLSTFALEDGRLGEPQSFDDFTDVNVQQDGTIIGLHPVHGLMILGRIDLATFDNPNGLAKVGGTNFQETVASGPAQLGIPGEGGTGVVLSGTLEMSNVDLADEFTNTITTQRGYQANSRVITVSDTMLEELLSLKR